MARKPTRAKPTRAKPKTVEIPRSAAVRDVNKPGDDCTIDELVQRSRWLWLLFHELNASESLWHWARAHIDGKGVPLTPEIVERALREMRGPDPDPWLELVSKIGNSTLRNWICAVRDGHAGPLTAEILERAAHEIRQFDAADASDDPYSMDFRPIRLVKGTK